MIALEVRSVSKNYPLEDSQWARLRHVLSPGSARSREGVWALRNVSFQLARGEAFGIIGANGSGKSTLLQIVAGILRPTSGEVTVHGRLSALLELGSGFSPEFSGRENVYLNASILGFTREQTEERFPAIERFAAIGDFIDQPIRTYSSGMVLRLAFAVVAHVDPEILIVDEALAVGDIAFRQRCMRRIHELRAAGTTILYVSHDTGDVKALCERCLWLERGEVRAIGDSDDVVARYLSSLMQPREKVPSAALPAVVAGTHRFGNGKAVITGTSLSPGWKARQPTTLRVAFTVQAGIDAPMAGFLLRNSRGETIFGCNTLREDFPMPAMRPGDSHAVDFHMVPPELTPGEYKVSVAVSEGTLHDFAVCDYVEDALTVQAVSEAPAKGYLRLRCTSISVYRSSQNTVS